MHFSKLRKLLRIDSFCGKSYHSTSILVLKTNPNNKTVFNNYPDFAKSKMFKISALLIEIVDEATQITTLSEPEIIKRVN